MKARGRVFSGVKPRLPLAIVFSYIIDFISCFCTLHRILPALIPLLCQYPPIHIPPPSLYFPILLPDMDVYTTSFTYPRRSRHVHTPSSSLDFPSTSDSYSAPHHLQQQASNNLSDVSPSADPEAIQKLAMMAMSSHGCHVSYFLADHGRGWNFHITGAYQQVMATRGMILKECPIQVSGHRFFHPSLLTYICPSIVLPSR